MSNFENLKVWQKAVDLAITIYNLTNECKSFKNDFGLRDQVRRAAVSISSNISEGDELGTDKQSVRLFYIAKGSAAELYTQLIISHKIGYITKDDYELFSSECKSISAMLTNLIRSRSKN